MRKKWRLRFLVVGVSLAIGMAVGLAPVVKADQCGCSATCATWGCNSYDQCDQDDTGYKVGAPGMGRGYTVVGVCGHLELWSGLGCWTTGGGCGGPMWGSQCTW